MATTSTTNPADVASRLQTYFSPKLLAHAKPMLRLCEFGMKASLPANAASKTIRFFRKRAPSTTNIQSLGEGTPISTFDEVALDTVDLTLAQRGQAVKITDVLRAIDMFPVLKMNIATMGEDAALDFDTITRNAIMDGMEDSDGRHERFAGYVPETPDSDVDFGTFIAKTAAETKITRAAALACATQLKTANAPKINGSYVGIIAPEVSHDFVQDDDWLHASQYSAVDQLFNGEIGRLDGIRYVEATNPYREGATYGSYSASGSVFTTMFLGRDAFGTVDLSSKQSMGSPRRPQVIVVDKADSGNPLNQFVTAGWKAFWNAVVLNSTFLVVLRSKTTFA